MCGIAGIVNFKQKIPEYQLPKLLEAIQHRGPDAQAMAYFGAVALAHARLSIIDLSYAANQPFQSVDERFAIVFNGEIYNYIEIKNKILEAFPEQLFKSNSDTEVIIEAYRLFGFDGLQLLNGMFAFCLYDKTKNEILLCRDRIGIKPLFYYFEGDCLYFASEPDAIVKAIDKPFEINANALSCFLNLGFSPNEQSNFHGIKKLLPGHTLTFNAHGIQMNCYWDFKNQIKTKCVTDNIQAQKDVKTIIEDAVRLNLISDVPVGVFLSGGMDSSLVAAIAKQHVAESLNTFSIGFENARFNELKYARKIAEHIDSNHHEFVLSSKQAAEIALDALDAYGEPFADSSALPTYFISKLAKPHVKTVLVGDGNDELFMGYGIYNWAERTDLNWVKSMQSVIHNYWKFHFNKPKQRYQHYFEANHSLNQQQKLFSAEQNFFSQSDISNFFLLPSFSAKAFSIEHIARRLSAKEVQALFDLDTYLPSDLLVKTDRASMRNGLEVRVPLLDHRLVEYALNLDQKLKTQHGIGKRIIVDILKSYYPENYFDRPKWGFAIPLSDWLRTDLKFLIHDYLNEKVIHQFGIVDYSYVKSLITQFNSGLDYLDKRIWQLIVLHRWLLKNDMYLMSK